MAAKDMFKTVSDLVSGTVDDGAKTVRVRVTKPVSGFVPGKVYDVSKDFAMQLMDADMCKFIPTNDVLLRELLKEYDMAKPKKGDWERAAKEYWIKSFAEEQQL